MFRFFVLYFLLNFLIIYNANKIDLSIPNYIVFSAVKTDYEVIITILYKGG